MKTVAMAIAVGLSAYVCAGNALAANSFLGDWPTSLQTDSGYEFGIEGIYQYDSTRWSGDDGLFDNANAWHNQEFDAYVKMPFGLEVHTGYDFKTESWAGNYFKVSSSKAGDFRLGQFKTPVGWDENESLSAQTFLQRSLPGSAIYEGRRLGVDWTYGGIKDLTLVGAYYNGGDLNGDNDGHSYAGRIVYTPVHTDTDVIHVGGAVSREFRDSGTVKIGTTPEAGLTDTHLVTTGMLTNVNAIDRLGVEAGWMHGPFYAQGEYLRVNAQRTEGVSDFTGDGYYVFGAWMLTGESRAYQDTYFTNVIPRHTYGAVEVAVRYSQLDLRDHMVQGGTQRDWTLGLNWYVGQHLKLQADYVWAHANESPANAYVSSLRPRVLELRAQVYF